MAATWQGSVIYLQNSSGWELCYSQNENQCSYARWGNWSDPGLCLPKISVPSFDGNLRNWNTFWEQFEIAIHLKEQLMDAEKLAYSKDNLKDGPVRHAIKGLTQTSETTPKQSRVSKTVMIVHGSSIKPMFVRSLRLLLWKTATVRNCISYMT